ncbi:MAG: M24 family metallopeptidase [Acidobacteria bacterium]|nr:M24 family metallopeptidase [Acidobacteriota bacterium]
MQAELREQGLDGWLFFDHHQRDPLAYRVLRFQPAQQVTRRWYYFVPAEGQPVRIVHRIESHVLDPLPGSLVAYAGWSAQRAALASCLSGSKRIAMQYSADCAVPYVAMVDAGTVELIRSLGVEVASSADLVQIFEATWTAEQFQQHRQAGVLVDAIRRSAFQFAGDRLRQGQTVGEIDVQRFILEAFDREGLFTDHGPIVAVNDHASDPHYEPSPEKSRLIQKGDLLLIDLWAKLRQPGAVYYDITWTGYCGAVPPDRMQNVFRVVTGARDAAINRVQSAISGHQPLFGFQVDDAARGHIQAAGLEEYFFHRTGHSIGEDVHGTGANMDNLETHDERRVIPSTCFSIEPGVYLPEFGVRSEINMFIGLDEAVVTGEIQREMVIVGG